MNVACSLLNMPSRPQATSLDFYFWLLNFFDNNKDFPHKCQRRASVVLFALRVNVAFKDFDSMRESDAKDIKYYGSKNITDNSF